MRLLVCGGRDFGSTAREVAVLREVLDTWHARRPITLLIHGAAPGADSLAAAWAAEARVERLAFPADWTAHGKQAGMMRNADMLTRGAPLAAVAFPGGRGTADMVSRCRAAGVAVALVSVTQDGWRIER